MAHDQLLASADHGTPPTIAPDGYDALGPGLSGPGDVPRIEGYTLIERLGSGGMGHVWRAEQTATRRQVALKLMTAALFDDVRARALFDREVQLTASLEHPNIARVYDSGIDQGVYFYAMELVHGVALDEFVHQRKLSPRQIVALMATVCAAVQYAHQRGVIHRDLKPQNIFVSPDGKPHVLDFGLAKPLLHSTVDAMPMASADERVAGTPAFMSPEQASGSVGRVDTRSDVYSLGVIFYRLLTSHMPHDTSGTPLEVMARILHQDLIPPRKVTPSLDAELEAILLRALARNPDDRYATAGELRRDLRGYLRGEPVVAMGNSARYLLRKRIRRYRTPLLVMAAAAIVLLAVAVGAFHRVSSERNAALLARGLAERQEQIANSERTESELRLAESLVAQGDSLGSAGQWGQARLRHAEARRIFSRLGVPATLAELGLWDCFRHSPAPLMLYPVGGSGTVMARAFQDGTWRGVSMATTGQVVVRDLQIGRILRMGQISPVSVGAIAVSGDGKSIGFAGGAGGPAYVWDLEAQTMPRPLGPASAMSAALTPDGSQLILGGTDGIVRVIDTRDGRQISQHQKHSAMVISLAVAADGRTVASNGFHEGRSIRVWDLQTGQDRPFDHAVGAFGRLDLSPAGSVLAVAAPVLSLWDLPNDKLIQQMPDAGCDLTNVAVSSDGLRVAAGGADGVIRLWDVPTGRSTWTFGQAGAQTGPLVSFCADSRMLLSGSGGNEVPFMRLWHAQTDRQMTELPGHEGGTLALATSSDGRMLLSGGVDGAARLWDVGTGRLLDAITPGQGEITSVAIAPDGTTAAVGCEKGPIVLWDLVQGRESVRLEGHTSIVHDMEFLPDGRRLVSGAADGMLRLWDLAAASAVASTRAHNQVMWLDVSQDGRRLVSGGRDTSARLWRIGKGFSEGPTIQLGESSWMGIVPVEFLNDDATRLATGAAGLAFFDISDERAVRQTGPQSEAAGRTLAVHPMGEVALVGDRSLFLCDLKGGRILWKQTIAPDRITTCAWSPKGRTAFTATTEPTIRVWDFDWLSRYEQLQAEVAVALQALQSDPGNGKALVVLGEWYAFRGVDDWAAPVMVRAREAGARVSAVALARSYWAMNDLAAARREFQAAREAGEAPAAYLNLCIAAIDETR
jgi:WD40 repeat protein